MLQYELFQSRQQELHREAEHERLVLRALRSRREARRMAKAAAAAAAAEPTNTGWKAGDFRPAA
ncbi:hypothetical protein [Yinghuangia soli]|uniref:Uncharacterized protein n=1 Tax=Yinghuangia soli TaxID=2908204 RepID=A0AA41PX61_9ACTN|nr:hypothetical protein [Yinghuangia soli]MCF2527336.1 hypothetical protein [Yinghuangia soli]